MSDLKGNDLNENFGSLVEMSLGEALERGTELRNHLYDKKVLVIRGLGELTTDQLWDVHALFGKPWSRHDYSMSIKEKMHSGSYDKNVAYFGTDIYNRNVKNGELAWHRDIPWHREIKYPIRSLYAHEAYKTPTLFADADILLDTKSETQFEYLQALRIKIQYWYHRQYDTKEKRHDVKTTYVPFMEYHPHQGLHSPMLNSFSLESSQEARKKHPFMSSFQAGWILGASLHGEPMKDADYLELFNYLHEQVCTPENTMMWQYQKHDLVLFDNHSGVFHSRASVAEEDGKRSFYRMNVRHYWQSEQARDL